MLTRERAQKKKERRRDSQKPWNITRFSFTHPLPSLSRFLFFFFKRVSNIISPHAEISRASLSLCVPLLFIYLSLVVLTFLFTTQNLRGNRKKRWETRAITSVHINLALVFVFTCRVIFWSIQLCRVALAYATVYCAKRKGRPFQWQTITETIYSFIHIHKWTAYIIYEFIVLALKMADDRWRRRVFFFFFR